MFDLNKTAKLFPQPLDRAATAAIAILLVAIVALLLTGNTSVPRIREFTWQNRQIGAEDKAFILTFSRPMNRASVEENLRIDPPLPGKISWAGRRMAYTLTAPVPYGQEFEVQLQGSTEKFAAPNNIEVSIEPFIGKFRSRDRAFAYLGVDEAEEGQLILYNLSEEPQHKRVLTPKHLLVMDYKPYPKGDKILFSAIEREAKGKKALEQKLYTVTTGISPQSPGTKAISVQPPGKLELVLDSKNYRNFKFDLSADGNIIVVRRQSKRNLLDFSLWIIKAGEKPKPLYDKPGGDFAIAPDSRSLALLQGSDGAGVAILPLEPDAEPLDFLPKFEMLLNFSQDSSAAAMVKFNRDPNNPSRSLFAVLPSQGIEKELLRTKGRIVDAQFDPTNKILYCLLTKLIEEEEYKEEPYIAAIDVQTGELKPLVLLPDQRDIQMSLSPDGLALLFDQAVTATRDRNSSQHRGPKTNMGQSVTTSRLWLIPLLPDVPLQDLPAPIPTELLPFNGLRPQWLP